MMGMVRKWRSRSRDFFQQHHRAARDAAVSRGLPCECEIVALFLPSLPEKPVLAIPAGFEPATLRVEI